MNRLWIHTTAATLATAATMSVLGGIDALARHQASSTASANTMSDAQRGSRVASLSVSCRAEQRSARAALARCL